MKKHKRFIIKSGIFLLILGYTIFLLTRIFLPKAFFSYNWPNTSTTVNFYKMEQDSIDVLFLGSSHCVSAFNPQELYDKYGLRSYNLGTEQQSILVSYYWLKEVLRYQHPQVVVLDTYICFSYRDNPLNSREAAVRYAMDSMRWSAVKREAIHVICEYDESQTEISYYNLLNRFHGRWTSLEEDDFTYAERLSHDEMKGYSLLSDRSENEDYQPFEIVESIEPAVMVPLMKEYLDKIVSLCKENGIELILVKTPTTASGAARYNCLSAYAQEHQIAYYDFNESSLYHEMEYQFSVDNADGGHCNYWGSVKVSDKMGGILAGEPYQVPIDYDEQWETSRDFYEAAVHNAELCYVTNIEEYLRAINRSSYSIFIAVKDEASASINNCIAEELQQLGLEIDLRGKYGYSYYAVISPKGVLEKTGEQRLSASGTFRDGRCTYKISSAGLEWGNDCSIVINDIEYAKKIEG